MCCSVMFGTLGRCPVFEINSIFIISLCKPLFFQCIPTLKMETKTKLIDEDFTKSFQVPLMLSKDQQHH